MFRYIILALILITKSIFNAGYSEANSYVYKVESHLSTSINSIFVPKHMDYTTYKLNGSWTDNYGNFGLIKCTGETRILVTKEVNIFGICEITDEDKNRKWWSLKRQKSELDLGVGKSKQLTGERIWSILNDMECNYAIKHAEGFSYMKTSCNINERQHKKLQANKTK